MRKLGSCSGPARGPPPPDTEAAAAIQPCHPAFQPGPHPHAASITWALYKISKSRVRATPAGSKPRSEDKQGR